MGLRFDMASANWVAHLLQPGGTVPAMEDRWQETETLRMFLQKMKDRFYSTPSHESHFASVVERTERMLYEVDQNRGAPTSAVLKEIRRFLGGRPWTALIVPSGSNSRIDNFLCNEELLRFIVNIRPDDPGIILQLEEVPKHGFSLLDQFPAFRTALAESNQWPGVLIWAKNGDSTFLPIGSDKRQLIEERSHWIFSHLATSTSADLEILKKQYLRAFPSVRTNSKSNIHFIQLSDLHVGSKEAGIRIPRVQQFVRNLVEELDSSGQIVPIISGDLMDSPKEDLLGITRSFIDFLSNVGGKEPLVVLGNHDVRKDGLMSEDFQKAMRLPVTSRVVWYEDAKVGMVCMNSVRGGKLARGFVGEEQLIDLGNEIDRKQNWKDFSILATLHHHPIPVEIPEWYLRPFYERILGSYFEKTDALEDASSVMSFLQQRNIAAVLHGHKHIPRAELFQNQIAVVGCGSSVGKVSTTDGGTYMSVNVVSVDGQTRRVTSRLLAERAPGGGLKEQKRHEYILRS